MYNEYNLYFDSFTKEYPLILSSLNLIRTRIFLTLVGRWIEWSSQQISSFELGRDLLFFKSSNAKGFRLKFFEILEAWSIELQGFGVFFFQLFDFLQLRNFVFTNFWHAQWDNLYLSSILHQLVTSFKALWLQRRLKSTILFLEQVKLILQLIQTLHQVLILPMLDPWQEEG